ncbi:hypothetical protein F5Y15DRAFT_412729 [Xylariaceae sp. FL0016]|nr:hypothetical protein F5Y15DRAFT_412729 [Xylariaceae sp. FL0016]
MRRLRHCMMVPDWEGGDGFSLVEPVVQFTDRPKCHEPHPTMLEFQVLYLGEAHCKGSALSPKVGDCWSAIDGIDVSGTFVDQTEFSVGSCYVKYATNGNGDQPISGQTIKDTCNAILDKCGSGHDSVGTGNCDECHVTMNFRV